MNKLLSYLGLYWLKFIVLIFSFTPFWLIYLYSDILSFLLYKVIGYRKKVVKNNLKLAFPKKSTDDINKITQQFYKHLSDIIFESLKGFSMTKKEIEDRYDFINPDLLNQYYENKTAVITVGGHFTNWEWALFATSFPTNYNGVCFYKTLNNSVFDTYVQENRGRFGSILASIKETTLKFNEYPKEAFIMIADQSPSNLKNAVWTKFLGLNTPVLKGVEKHAKRLNIPVLYIRFEKKKRGLYSVRLEKITDNPNQTEDGEISKAFMAKLEEDILKAPEYWLWSHKRWKRVSAEHLKGDFPTD